MRLTIENATHGDDLEVFILSSQEPTRQACGHAQCVNGCFGVVALVHRGRNVSQVVGAAQCAAIAEVNLRDHVRRLTGHHCFSHQNQRIFLRHH